MEKRPSKKTRKTKTTRKIKTLVIRTQFDPNYVPDKGEVNNMPSLTVPDMALTVQELLLNHSRGIHSEITDNQGQFFDQEIPRFDDMVDYMEYKKDLQQQLEDITIIAKKERESKLAALKAAKEKMEQQPIQQKTIQPEQPQVPQESQQPVSDDPKTENT